MSDYDPVCGLILEVRTPTWLGSVYRGSEGSVKRKL
jgi:hypothetical protein